MIFSVADLVGLGEQSLPSGLVSPGLWRGARRLSRALGTSLGACGVEFRLGESEPQVDFWTTIADGTGLEALASHVSKLRTRAWYRADPTWAGVLAFVMAWADPRSSLHGSIRNICLEFHQRTASQELVPITFFRLTTDAAMRAGVDGRRGLEDVVREGTELLCGRPLSFATYEHLLECWRRLPAGGAFVHVGPTRKRSSTRIVAAVPVDCAFEYLDRIDWRGPRDQVESWLGDTEQRGEVAIDLDIGETVGARVGLELASVRDGAQDGGWLELLGRMRSEGLCADAHAASLPRWLAGESGLAPQECPFVHLEREVLLKISLQSGAPPEAKAYLTWAPTLLPRLVAADGLRQTAS